MYLYQFVLLFNFGFINISFTQAIYRWRGRARGREQGVMFTLVHVKDGEREKERETSEPARPR